MLEIYALAVCFFSVACLVIVIGVALYDVVQITAPGFTLNRYEYQRLESNDAFRATPLALPGKSQEERKAMSEEEITKRREAAYVQALRTEKRDGAQSLVRMLIISLVDAIAFLIHWQIAKRTRQSTA